MICCVRFSHILKWIFCLVGILLLGSGTIYYFCSLQIIPDTPLPVEVAVNQTVETNHQEKNITASSRVLPEQYQGYEVIGRIEIPKIAVNSYILGTTTEDSLKYSVTKLCGPTMHTAGNFCISGHNFNNGKIFANVKKLEKGDVIWLQDVYGRKMEYEVFDTFVTSPKDVSCLKPSEEGAKETTLVTCTVTGLKRLIVKARVLYD